MTWRWPLTAATIVAGVLGVIALAAMPLADAQPAGSTTEYEVVVEISRQYDQPTSLYVPISVTVLEQRTGQPAEIVHEVVVRPTNSVGEDGGLFYLASDVAGHGGRYRGIVILPHEGEWTLEVAVNDAPPLRGRGGVPPEQLATTSLEVSVTGGILNSALGVQDPLRERLTGESGRYLQAVITFWIHTLASLGWTLTILALAVLGSVRMRGWLSADLVNRADARLGTLVRTSLWLLAVTVATGGVNIAREMAYRVPTSFAQFDRVAPLPYARPYLLAFMIKMALFAGMVGLSVVIIRRSRATSASWLDDVVPAGLETGGHAPPAPMASSATVAFLASAGLLLLSVTAVKYLHLVIEAFRAR